MDAATYTTVSSDTKYNAVGFNIGVVFSIKPKTGWIINTPNGSIYR
jgi:hypothetical protein